MRSERSVPSIPLALLPVLGLVVFFALGAIFLGVSGELLIVVLLAAAVVASGVARGHGAGWEEIQAAMGEKVRAVLPALLILLAIGMLIASWMLSGTIPYLVYWGVRLIRPEYLALTAFLATATMSLFTGTSWGSAGTVGVALVGTAVALGAPLGITAGAVVSGAYFGDKMSPLSDTTNVAAIAAEADLYEHIRHMTYTAVPSFLLAGVVYAFAGGVAGDVVAGVPDSALRLTAELDAVFALNWATLIPAVIVIVSIARRAAPAPAIFVSSVVALALGITLQPFGIQDAIRAAVAGFDVGLIAPDPGTVAPDPGFGSDFTTLVERGGLYSMADTLIVIFAAFLLAAAMEASGSIEVLIGALLRGVRSVFGLIASTMAAGLTVVALTSNANVTALVVGELFQDAYDDRDLARVNLSRSLEDSATITEVLMPWTVSATFMAATLGVPTLTYAPWAIFCYGGPVFSLVIAGAWRWTRRGIRPASI